MNSKATEKQISALRRLAFADLSFRQAHLLCSHIEGLGPRNIANLWVPLLAGVAVTYMKPFGRGDGLGPLPASFSHFPLGSPHRQTHDDIAGGRNWTYAHRDILSAARLLSTAKERQAISEIGIHFIKGSTTIYVREPAWHPETIFRIRELCQFQSCRVSAQVRSLVLTLAAKKSYAGKYVLGRDFP